MSKLIGRFSGDNDKEFIDSRLNYHPPLSPNDGSDEKTNNWERKFLERESQEDTPGTQVAIKSATKSQVRAKHHKFTPYVDLLKGADYIARDKSSDSRQWSPRREWYESTEEYEKRVVDLWETKYH